MSVRTLPLAVVALGLALSFAVSAAAQEDGFKPLFNGTSLEGWDGNPKFWSVKEGVIVGETTKDNPTKGNTFLIYKGGNVDDFELRLSYKIVGGNSGIQYRSKAGDDWRVTGYQADFEAGDTYSGILYDEGGGRNILAARGKKVEIAADGKKTETTIADSKELQANIKKEDWNEYVVIAKGNSLKHMINGKVTAEVIDGDEKKQALSGILALQLHAGPPMNVQFKNIRIKSLK